MKLKPIINFNGGIPIALCNRCFVIMCSVTYTGEAKSADGYVVSEIKYDHFGEPCIKSKRGEIPPIYCIKCNKLLTYSINE